MQEIILNQNEQILLTVFFCISGLYSGIITWKYLNEQPIDEDDVMRRFGEHRSGPLRPELPPSQGGTRKRNRLRKK